MSKRWWIFAGCTLLAFVIQTLPRLYDVPLVDFNWLLTLGLIAALVMPTPDARLAAFFTGLAADLGSSGAVGPHAFAFGLAGLVVTLLREAVNLNFWLARFLIALGPALAAQLFLLLYGRFWLGLAPQGFFTTFLNQVLTGAFAALLAAVVTQVPALLRMRRRERTSAWRRA